MRFMVLCSTVPFTNQSTATITQTAGTVDLDKAAGCVWPVSDQQVRRTVSTLFFSL